MPSNTLVATFLSLLLAVSAPGAIAWPSGASPDANSGGAAAEPGGHSSLFAEHPAMVANSGLPGYTIRHTVPEVRIQFTVADDHGRLLHSLSRGDFHILDDRVAVPQIRNFSRLDDLPLQVGILLDASDSVRKAATRERQAIQFFVQHVLRPQTDRAALMAFSSDFRLWQPPTGDRDALNQTLTKIQQLGFATFLYDGVYRSCVDQFPVSPEGDYAQRVLVLITDGYDTGSLHTLADAISAAQRSEVQIFALSVHSPRVEAEGDKALRRLADATGGQFYLASSEKDFPAIFTAMEQQMRTQYSVSFQPATRAPGLHPVSIAVAGGETLRVHARQAYFYDAP